MADNRLDARLEYAIEAGEKAATAVMEGSIPEPKCSDHWGNRIAGLLLPYRQAMRGQDTEIAERDETILNLRARNERQSQAISDNWLEIARLQNLLKAKTDEIGGLKGRIKRMATSRR